MADKLKRQRRDDPTVVPHDDPAWDDTGVWVIDRDLDQRDGEAGDE